MVASGAELVDELVQGKRMRVVRVEQVLNNANGRQVAEKVVFYKSLGGEGYPVKSVLNGRYDTVYKWNDIPGYSLPEIEVSDRRTGQTVMRTAELSTIPESGGLFRGTEVHYANGSPVCEIDFVRHAGSGLLVGEEILVGALPLDLHPYEFELGGWPIRNR